MAENTVLPTTAAEAKDKLANNPATRQAYNYSVVNNASKNGTSASLAPKQVKKSWIDKVKEGWSELTSEDTPEVAAQRKAQREKERDVLKAKMAKQAEGLAIEGGALGTMLVPGLKGKAAVAMGAGALANAAANEGKKAVKKLEAPEVKEPKTDGDEPPIPPKGDKAPTTTEEPTRDGYQEYENEIAAARGLGKYIGKDGKLDYNKLQRSKVGYGILNALAGALAGAGAGAAGQAAPDMSKGILGREMAKRDEVVEKIDEARRSKLRQDEDMSTFVKKLGLQGAENERIQKEMARFMSNLNFEDQKRLNNYLKNMPIEDAIKMGIVQNPQGFLGMALNAAGSGVGSFLGQFAKSDEGCKKFATKKVFR